LSVIYDPTVRGSKETIRLNRLPWFGHVKRLEENRIPPKSIINEFGNKKADRRTKTQMAR
jgi:hypothetical protein